LDDAGGGRRALRAQPSAELLDALKRDYAIEPSTPPADLGGSSNLNLLVVHRDRKLVVRVYRPSVSAARLADIQSARRQLALHSFPCLVPMPTSDGRDWVTVSGRLLEVEEYVASDGRMNTAERVEAGLRVLRRMHNVLRPMIAGPDGETPSFVNHITPEDVLEATARGVARVRSWSPTAQEARLADAAEELAFVVTGVHEASGYASLPEQLVHGDFWDNNVLFRGRDIVLIHDFDHMGKRARIDDVALTVYYVLSEPAVDLGPDAVRQLVRRLVDTYDAELDSGLSATERAALPVALARQPLWSVGGWIANLDDDAAARAHANGMTAHVDFALDVMRSLPQWQEALV
jgi:homoserine kinase type II